MERRYNIEELCRIVGVKRRTVHFYVQEKLLPPPAGRGMGGYYDERHVETLKEILRLRKEGMGLAAIGNLLRSGAMERAREECAELALPVPAPWQSVEEPRAAWDTEECVRYRIAPGVEILVDRKVREELPGKVERLITAAKEFFKHEEER